MRILSEEREGKLQGSSSGCLAAQIQRCTESTRLPGPLAGVFSPGLPEADSVGAQKLYDRGRFPSTLLPSRDMCRCFWADPACLCSRPQPQLRGSRPSGKTCWRSPEPPPDRRVHSQQGSEPPRGKRRQPSPDKLKALLARSQVRLQYGRALALLRGPIWQGSWCVAALMCASLAQTCPAFRLPPLDEAGSSSLGDATRAFLSSPLLLPFLCT